MRRKLLLVLLVLILLFIWGQSCLPSALSDRESGSVLDASRPFLERLLGEGRVTMYLIRKLAHFAEYFALGCVASLLFPLSLHRQALCAGLCLLAGLLDETIQIFSGRGDQVRDIWLDFAGALAAILIVCLLRRPAAKKRCGKMAPGEENGRETKS